MRPWSMTAMRWATRSASSRNRTRGECRDARAISSRRFMPPEKACVCWPRRSHSSNSLSSDSLRPRRSRRGTEYSAACSSMFSCAVNTPSRLGSWNTMPKRRRAWCGWAATSSPSMRMLPLVGFSSVVSILMVVVLPAPLGPRKANTSPRPTVKSRPRTAWKVPKVRTSPWTSIMPSMPSPVRTCHAARAAARRPRGWPGSAAWRAPSSTRAGRWP